MPYRESAYDLWMQREGLPVVGGHGVTDVSQLNLAPWPRLGGRGAFIQLQGMEGFTGMYVVEISPGDSLEPERHMYEELIYVLSGEGTTELWHDGPSDPESHPDAGTRDAAHCFEWRAGALFAPPLNMWHRFNNLSGSEPAHLVGVTNAPMILDLYHNTEFVFGCDFDFRDRYDGRPDYFKVGEVQGRDSPWGQTWVWETNLIPDVRGKEMNRLEAKGSGFRGISYEMAGNVLVGHVAEWPAGRYQKCHYHLGGAVLLIVRSRGYTLMWPRELGPHPYQDGHEDQVVRVDWQEGSVFSPPTGWFHQHFNTGEGPARQLALRFGSRNYEVKFNDAYAGAGPLVSLREGGTMIEYEDEDPQIAEMFRRELEAAGVPYQMPELKRVVR